jgi:hypothetical protein
MMIESAWRLHCIDFTPILAESPLPCHAQMTHEPNSGLHSRLEAKSKITVFTRSLIPISLNFDVELSASCDNCDIELLDALPTICKFLGLRVQDFIEPYFWPCYSLILIYSSPSMFSSSSVVTFRVRYFVFRDLQALLIIMIALTKTSPEMICKKSNGKYLEARHQLWVPKTTLERKFEPNCHLYVHSYHLVRCTVHQQPFW